MDGMAEEEVVDNVGEEGGGGGSGGSGAARLIADLPALQCERPSFLNRRSLSRVPIEDFSCDHDYYDYFYYYDEPS